MNFKKNILSLSTSIALLGLAGCGVTTQDQGLGNASAKAISGVAVDGYIARAVVYVDTNENNKLDVWEPRALTDSRGYFTYSPEYIDKKGETVNAIKYCELATTDANYTYCLKIPAGYDEVVIRMTKGIDLSTLDPFTGTLSMRVSSNTNAINLVNVGTPITGLLAEMDETQKTQFLSDEGIEGTAASDFLDFSTSSSLEGKEADRLKLLTLALRIHKVSDAIAGYLDVKLDAALGKNKGGVFGVLEGMPADASVYVYQAIVGRMTAQETVGALLANTNSVEGVVSDAWNFMKKAFDEFDSSTVTITDPDFTSISQNAVALSNATRTVFTAPLAANGSYTDSDSVSQNYTLADDARSRIRAIDIISSLIRADSNPAAISNAITLISDTDYMANLKSPKTDITGLKSKFTASPGAIVANDSNYDARKSFSELLGETESGTGLTGSDGEAANEEGFAGNTLAMDDGEDNVGISFISKDENGATVADATSGTVEIDATLLSGDYAKKDENGDPAPLKLEGTWEQLDEYTMLMNIEVAGVVEPVIVKPTVTDDGKAAYYFDLGGEQQIWIP